MVASDVPLPARIEVIPAGAEGWGPGVPARPVRADGGPSRHAQAPEAGGPGDDTEIPEREKADPDLKADPRGEKEDPEDEKAKTNTRKKKHKKEKNTMKPDLNTDPQGEKETPEDEKADPDLKADPQDAKKDLEDEKVDPDREAD